MYQQLQEHVTEFMHKIWEEINRLFENLEWDPTCDDIYPEAQKGAVGGYHIWDS